MDKLTKSKIQYMETRVPELIRDGVHIGEATTKASEEWEAKAPNRQRTEAETEALDVCYETSIEFSAEVTETGFKDLTQEEDVVSEKSFSEVLRMLGCQPGKRYEIEICVEEEDV